MVDQKKKQQAETDLLLKAERQKLEDELDERYEELRMELGLHRNDQSSDYARLLPCIGLKVIRVCISPVYTVTTIWAYCWIALVTFYLVWALSCDFPLSSSSWVIFSCLVSFFPCKIQRKIILVYHRDVLSWCLIY